jgi:hypothetical protein
VDKHFHERLPGVKNQSPFFFPCFSCLFPALALPPGAGDFPGGLAAFEQPLLAFSRPCTGEGLVRPAIHLSFGTHAAESRPRKARRLPPAT